MSTNRMHDEIDQLLYDAESADSGAAFARMMANQSRDAAGREHAATAAAYAAKRDAVSARALALDPDRTAPAWDETSLCPSRIAAAAPQTESPTR